MACIPGAMGLVPWGPKIRGNRSESQYILFKKNWTNFSGFDLGLDAYDLELIYDIDLDIYGVIGQIKIILLQIILFLKINF
jgi:hypothetical protein